MSGKNIKKICFIDWSRVYPLGGKSSVLWLEISFHGDVPADPLKRFLRPITDNDNFYYTYPNSNALIAIFIYKPTTLHLKQALSAT